MIGWVARVLFGRSAGQPDDERSIRKRQLEAAAKEVRQQTQRVSRIRIEAQAAQRRVEHR